uniref:HRDC domain-containing protein n=1 Tax=Pseudo-nitzschia australis TaxID=44445 RepID=A0A7S4AKJ7_9STRA|mmetsp:Transcript_10106/g.21697  ORF Transcript_10106/g.21697 Transcript_10106/m.21697 type:complete len:1054 (-) Transcript_10106:79-3240(-)|eukprot:CAMPEP_0168193746 /NCGR_PEP_ID=MMETSP0139_2-20121125/18780_1 /TAXON_ID=44445 /ORGANISM="Pseudo-nitzschia australis, Strain 10249 10 AB" /LENGTH=1053 /DNA_ID=CAMNT_0008117141 /DNA_START=267 /DNA_END=3428 /DNA_ORIENTATION=+
MTKNEGVDDGNSNHNRSNSSASCVEDILSELMTALATGARAVQGLPLGDDFDYQSSFPEFRQFLDDSQESLLEALLMTLDDASSSLSLDKSNNHQHIDFENLDDPLLWETCTDLCDALLEQAELSIASNRSTSLGGKLSRELKTTRKHAQSSFGRLLEGIVEMEKPQIVHKFGPFSTDLKVHDDEDMEINTNDAIRTGNSNGRNDVFVPPFLKLKYFFKEPLLGLDDPEWRQSGHGVETKLGEMKPVRVSPNVIAPSHHYKHPYLEELQSIDYPKWQLEIPSKKPLKIPKADGPLSRNSTWIDTPKGLTDLKTLLESDELGLREIAIDLEAHSYRSFSGMICLIQISIKDGKDFLIDPFPLWNHIHDALARTLANPSIVKVFHGADSDIAWLQRDFGLYVVNLFDTGRAARALKLPSAGFAYLLENYVEDVEADKSHQLSDWRQRPLPSTMKEYAIMDTHYLLDIYNALKYDLAHDKNTSIENALEESRKVCTIRYTPEVFRPDGYRSLTQRRGHKTQLNNRQDSVLRELWDWRDQVARENDESNSFVCINTQLMRVAMACPINLSTLQGLLQPMPPLLLRNSKEVLAIIQNCLNSQQQQRKQDRPSSSAYFKPANPDEDNMEDNETPRRLSPRSLMSPVLGTDALYRELGWISPADKLSGKEDGDGIVEDILTTSATDNDSDDDGDKLKGNSWGEGQANKDRFNRKPGRGLAVHDANQNFQSRQFTLHSLKMGGNDPPTETSNSSKTNSDTKRGELIDGFGPARMTHLTSEDMEEAVELAKSSAAQIRTSQETCGIIGLISSSADLRDEGDDRGDLVGNDDDQVGEKGKTPEQEEFVIPRSMREIYRISNRNRRNKKSSSPLPQEHDEEELKELEKAELILKSRSSEGKNYIDMIPSSPKRQRTKSSGAASLSSSEDAIGQDSGSLTREDDIALMQEVGWVEGEEEINSMLKQRHDADGDDDESSEDGAKRGETPKPFDYSNVGSIGAFNPTPSANPFFSGAALNGGHLIQQANKMDKKKTSTVGNRGGKQTRRQAERPDKRGARSQAYKKG